MPTRQYDLGTMSQSSIHRKSNIRGKGTAARRLLASADRLILAARDLERARKALAKESDARAEAEAAQT